MLAHNICAECTISATSMRRPRKARTTVGELSQMKEASGTAKRESTRFIDAAHNRQSVALQCTPAF